ncbi:beta-ketoacyl-[acyl-carrier-protein] synthase family protein [Rhodospirillum rubrum]|uniref:beta-ketoacyl-[acyl-carrier-protein] synthase family protein n=1 Tax=Rhodospirillum rubrum TaxID=1085 RepID=UPI0028B0DBD2|nr:beta-ketoacyl-[acyl-carrier-protein] synthase family protein [Rhodospirillum rubrum]
MRTVAITGLGIVAATGVGVPSFWADVCAGEPRFSPLPPFAQGTLGFGLGAQALAFDPERFFGRRQQGHLDRFAQLALVAAREAVADSGLDWSEDLRARSAVVTGSAIGGELTQDEAFLRIYGHGGQQVNPVTIPRVMPSAGAVAISMEFGLTGPVLTHSTACSSASHAIGQAFMMVRSGMVDIAIAGGSEAPFAFGYLKAWEAMQVVSPEACRPFSLGRKGMSLGEAGAMLVLEPLERAQARGARIYAELAGFGMSSDASHLTRPHEAGPARAIPAALDDAGLSPGEIGHINAHGTGTVMNDTVEARAIREVFGETIPMLTSTKAVHGHTLGAAGAVEAIATVLAVSDAMVPPTAGFTAFDPECGLAPVSGAASPPRHRAALSHSFAFGGLNAVLAFRPTDSAENRR